jgi:hypothetical protein
VFRGQTIVHSELVRRAGVRIWRQPLARASHRPPHVSDVPARLYRAGVDSGSLGRLVGDAAGRSYVGGMEPLSHRGSRLRNATQRARTVFAEDRRRFLYLPLALPIVAVAAGAYSLGRLRAAMVPVRPSTLHSVG